MTQLEIDESVAAATGEIITLVQARGIGIVHPFDGYYDPGPRDPLVLDWDEMAPILWRRW